MSLIIPGRAFAGAVRFGRDDQEVFENTVASLVDVTSILFAYQIGVSGFGIGLGVVYAMFDAFIVVWMRKPISRFARWVSPYRLRGSPSAQGGAVPSSPGTTEPETIPSASGQ